MIGEDIVRALTAGLLGVATVAASLVVLRQPRPQRESEPAVHPTPRAERAEAPISLDRIRELGL